ncbi:IST1 homolog isoform X1 [Echinops telfairi]|uniref:IST1 homolog isoform X1 n=4 Tax=Echinops telfairi TaxID=9371 RepID=A0AC55DCV6_ECHTE|nr:IST1 homolog isoform X1 [Echinops telfairi]XP_045149569.1 IST1 homolog isoform X1 [Echinops telfairi]XP_045149570.1 IST1 homolog isoform X1 [Echinops telfairi]XP_045149571.1 IST1 homolog isoform X1 [Echinops telfairi]
MMFNPGFKADRLRVNLQLASTRLKLLEKKKTEQTQKARKEIADYLASGKDERARVRVEHVIREDYLVEAMEILRLYCDLLLARFSLMQATKELDSGLAESVSTLIWAAPRLQSEVPELKTVSNQLCAKYSQEYGQLCRTNEIGTVSSRLMCKLNMDMLPQGLVEQYLIEIARNYSVPYNPTVRGEAPAHLISIGFTGDVKKDALGRGDGTIARNDDPLGASPIATLGPLPAPSQASCFSSIPPERENNDCKKNDLLPALTPSPGLNPQTLPKSESRIKIGFDNFMLPDLPEVKLQASSSIDPYDSEEVDFEDLNRRLEMLKKTT